MFATDDAKASPVSSRSKMSFSYRKTVALHEGDRRQCNPVCNVTHSVDVVHTRLGVLVHLKRNGS